MFQPLPDHTLLLVLEEQNAGGGFAFGDRQMDSLDGKLLAGNPNIQKIHSRFHLRESGKTGFIGGDGGGERWE